MSRRPNIDKAFTALISFAAILAAIWPQGSFAAKPGSRDAFMPGWSASPDTVLYPVSGYKLHRKGNFEAAAIADSLLSSADSLLLESESAPEDTLPHLTARDTIKAPDSLRLTDPFRYQWYVATIDSLTHRIVKDSLKACAKQYSDSSKAKFARLDSLSARVDSLLAEDNLLTMRRVDTLYYADSTAKAKAAFIAWYNSLDKTARKRYDMEQKAKIQLAKRDSLNKIKEDKKTYRDSLIENTPRILETYAVPDTMFYKRIFAWTPSRDFLDVNAYIPDTTANYHFHDYEWQRKDVNATWLGVPGSPVQYYNYFNRKSVTGVEFWEANESWTFSPQTMIQYNTKTPHTELAYYGTLFAGNSKEADNVHILSTQNITPEMNFSILYDRWGGAGILQNEKTANKTFAAGLNYLGKKYSADFGFISNTVTRGENGGIYDTKHPGNELFWVRDTLIEAREIPVKYLKAQSVSKKTTLYGDQQFKIAFNEKTSAFLGHGIEYSSFEREFNVGTGGAEPDSVKQRRLDNKVYLRFQPWDDQSIISKLDVGVGDYLHTFTHDFGASEEKLTAVENSLYAYAGAKGQYLNYFDWGANAHMVFMGSDAGNMDAEGHLTFKFYPFRKARTSAVSITAKAGTSLTKPNFFQRLLLADAGTFSSESKVQALVSAPYLDFEAQAGYALLSGNLYYTPQSTIECNHTPMSVMSAYIRKQFSFDNFLFLDNRVLVQYSSNQQVLPLPLVSANLRYYIQFPVEPGVLDMQVGADIWCNTPWYSPSWNPQLGVFVNQEEYKYTNGPFFDVFVNMQWKNVCLFVKFQNLGQGWPMDKRDYFSANRYIITEGGMPGMKLGIWWPFYTSPTRNRKVGS